MSNTKLAAARELVQEKNYDAARKILETMDDPTARKWLAQIKSVAPQDILPPAPPTQPERLGQSYVISAEQEQFYRAENRLRRRRHIGYGIKLIFLGICGLIAFAIFGIPTSSSELLPNFGVCFAPLGIVAILAGLYNIFKSD
ncbi:MAG: hypothetical protein ABI690_24775 [Chloroflexota bacterium]